VVARGRGHELVTVVTAAEQERFCSLPGLGPLDAETVARHAPDAQWLLLDRGFPAARCSLWYRATPPYRAERLGYIGHYVACDQPAAGALLAHACEELRRKGCTLAVAPIDGNTWRRYRLLTERGSRSPFFLEPDNPDDWPSHFTSHGFVPLARYFSSIAESVDVARTRTANPAMESVAAELSSQGLAIRPLDLGRFSEEMRAIFEISLSAFANNFLYSPISQEEFLAQYAAIRPHLTPDVVLIAEWKGEPVGFAFAVPDLFQLQRGEPLDTLVFKTLAVEPRFSRRGLGGLLVHRMHEAALAGGFRNIIHALMYEKNPSTRISARYAGVFRRYVLYAKALA
jgi:GNAT superfamily N-acetyltransferase